MNSPIFEDGKIQIPNPRIGSNSILIEFSNAYPSSDGSFVKGLSSFQDGRDQYVGTSYAPEHAHHVFPCFDQPDLKAKIKLSAFVPKEWQVVSNEKEVREFKDK